MRRPTICQTFALSVVWLTLFSAQTDAQPRRPQGPPVVFITVAGGLQATLSETTDRLEWIENVEPSTADVDYGSPRGGWIDAGVAARLWRQFGAGVAVSRAPRRGPASIDARIPHPFFFDRAREIAGGAGNLSRSETAVHVQVVYVVPAAGRIRAIVSAGPSRISARQDAVIGVRYTEEFPFDAAEFQRADVLALSGAAVGFHAGADVAYMLSRSLGVGGMARLSRASINLARPDGGRLATVAGGFQAGASLRLAF